MGATASIQKKSGMSAHDAQQSAILRSQNSVSLHRMRLSGELTGTRSRLSALSTDSLGLNRQRLSGDLEGAKSHLAALSTDSIGLHVQRLRSTPSAADLSPAARKRSCSPSLRRHSA
eukprot:gnl/TRDRNA2_/TRDRNA2_84408_c0_seq2.p1 gnl/TRDRNA2_/TRDRNA2_84408_c0~~gnl/TRDRNA2_/TRDRNA2_84408_c0_seq2.p1  ORF type:complete len:117 (-),score=7.84 gnl/TRDRNA2_/TRDRNA2_84408_c0_seq2:245-595(-)